MSVFVPVVATGWSVVAATASSAVALLKEAARLLLTRLSLGRDVDLDRTAIEVLQHFINVLLSAWALSLPNREHT